MKMSEDNSSLPSVSTAAKSGGGRFGFGGKKMMDVIPTANGVGKMVSNMSDKLSNKLLLGAIGCAIVCAVTYGNKDTTSNFITDLSLSMNKTDEEIVRIVGAYNAIFYGMGMIYAFFQSMMKTETLFTLGGSIIALLLYAAGYSTSLFYTGQGDYDVFMGVLLLGGAGLGWLYWIATSTLYSLATMVEGYSDDTDPVKKLVSKITTILGMYGIAYVFPMIFIGLNPLLLDVQENAMPAPGNLWASEQTSITTSSVFWIVLGLLLINMSVKNPEVKNSGKDTTWAKGDYVEYGLVMLSIAAFSAATYNPTIHLISWVQSQNFMSSPGVPEDNQLIASMFGWGGGLWRLLMVLILMAVAKFKYTWLDNVTILLLIVHLVGATACLASWAAGALNSYIGYLLWAFFFGATSSGGYMFYFFLFCSIWRAGDVSLQRANKVHLMSIFGIAFALFAGVLTSFMVGENTWKQTNADHVRYSITMSSGMMGGSAGCMIVVGLLRMFKPCGSKVGQVYNKTE